MQPDVTFFRAATSSYAEGSGVPSSPEISARYVRATQQITLEFVVRFLIDVVHDAYFGFDNMRYPNRHAHNVAHARGPHHLVQTVPCP